MCGKSRLVALLVFPWPCTPAWASFTGVTNRALWAAPPSFLRDVGKTISRRKVSDLGLMTSTDRKCGKFTQTQPHDVRMRPKHELNLCKLMATRTATSESSEMTSTHGFCVPARLIIYLGKVGESEKVRKSSCPLSRCACEPPFGLGPRTAMCLTVTGLLKRYILPI